MATWTQLTPAPISTSDAASCELDGKIYVAGGQVLGNPGSTLQIYDIASGSWSRGADMLYGVYSNSMIGVGRYVYSIGGLFSAGANSDIYRYNIDTNQWAAVGNMSRWSRNTPGLALIGDVIYIFGGHTDANVDGFPHEKEVYTLNTTTLNINLLGEILPVGRNNMGASVVDGVVYLAGGSEFDDYGNFNTNRHESFTPNSVSFRALSSLPATGTARSVAYGGEVYASSQGSLMIYNPDANEWRYGEPVPQGWLVGSLSVWDNQLFYMPHATNYPPFVLDLRTAEIVNMNPSAGFVDENSANTFSWQIQGNSSTVQASATFQWRVTGSSTSQNVPISGSSTQVTIPAGTFPNGNIQWRVSATTLEGISTDWSGWVSLTTIDQPHTKPTNLYPNSGSRNASESIQLSWAVNSPLSTPQSAFEVQVAYDDAMTWRILSGKVTSSQPSYNVPGGTFSPQAGNKVHWRVVTYNTDNQVGEWSDPVTFLAIPAPVAPQWVSVESGKSRPLARWIAADQIAYHLVVLLGDEQVHDSGWQRSTITEHRVLEYLKNGTYTFRVKYSNLFDQESEWADTTAVIQFNQTLDINLSGTVGDKAVNLDFTVKSR